MSRAADLSIERESGIAAPKENQLSLARATESDLDQILEIMNDEARRSLATAAHEDEGIEQWRESWTRSQSLYPWLVARRGARCLGYTKAGPYCDRDGYRWSVNLSVYLRPEVQGMGYSLQLYKRLFKILAAQGYQRAYARVALPNEASVRLHRRIGLKEVGRLPDFGWKFGRWYDVALYVGPIGTDQRLEGEGPPAIRPLSQLDAALFESEPLIGHPRLEAHQ